MSTIEMIEAQAKALAPVLRRLVNKTVADELATLNAELAEIRRRLAALEAGGPAKSVSRKPHVRLSGRAP